MKKLLLLFLAVVLLLSACEQQEHRANYDKDLLMAQATTDCVSILGIDSTQVNGISLVENITNDNNEVIAYISYDKENNYALKYEILDYQLFKLMEHDKNMSFNEI